MKKQKKYRRQKKNSPIMPIAIGVGLILFGFVLFAILRGTDEASASTPTDRSVVPMAVNYSAPQLALQNINGGAESLEDFGKDVVLVNNWATWCPPCKAEMPTLEKYYETHNKEGFTIIAIEAGDGKDQVMQFAESFNLKFPVWLDPDGAALDAFRNGNLPNSYVIDRNGTVRYAWTGEINLAMLEKYVTPIISESN
jgi:peroxiredoxin